MTGTLSSTFPQKLFAMSQLEFGQGVIHWLQHGMAFKVEDSDKFSEEVIPKYFKHTKLTSFQRQLNLYGFRRITKGDDHGAYFHPNFQRNRRDLISSIRRLPAKVNRNTVDTYAGTDTTPQSNSARYNSDLNLSLEENYELMEGYDEPPQKRKSPMNSMDESCNEKQQLNIPFPFYTNNQNITHPNMHHKRVNHPHSNPQKNHGLSISKSHSHSGYPTALPLPAMSKLTMNIGYLKHLASNSSFSQDNHQHGEAILEPSQYSSYNLLAKTKADEPPENESLKNSHIKDPYSYQQAFLQGQQQQPISDYPVQSNQLNSMYADTSNSSSINDFKLLMAQNDFSNWNDGSIWQPKAPIPPSPVDDIKNEFNNDYNDIFDDVPSFDEAMDMMSSVR
eukprot:CAMPEP_0119042296 /NCGR_PEP_ID=MMETSP1177-20130426/14522_1 /TAXON_ID=2985 /ORGANISM="Ochromonas sp, Strain CCMP1899" /LENGTH=391 /DNA_ID=CAMNT_0007008977 /DNA_START=160 /DNA_END=1335 /DNA_ORIENTATION=+